MKKYFSLEINGLRGLAITLVFIFHINQELFYLGYVGVDIFFVISGYVITKLIYERYLTNKFDIISFYINRIQRLYPALILFVFLGIITIFLLNISGHYKNFINTGLSSLLGLSNLYLNSIENNYFNSLDMNPFIHTWSLAIEFQFYILYPLFLIFCLKIFKNENSIIVIISLIIISIIFFGDFFKLKSFYGTTARIWEPLIGSLTFFIKSKKKSFDNLFLTIVLLLVLTCLLLLNLSISFSEKICTTVRWITLKL